MRFIHTAGWEDGTAELTERLARELKDGKRVLWLLSGGSNIKASVVAMDNLAGSLTDKLDLMLADERYGEPGHADSNWQQLIDAKFRVRQATVWPVLEPANGFIETARRYDETARQAFSRADVVIAQLGIGADGHLAGVLPDSVSAREKDAWVVGYDCPTYRRLTLTLPVIAKVDAAYVFAFGDAKQGTLRRLRDKQVPAVKQPSQVLKKVHEAYIYNDQIGD